jgi:hypothetical protein
LAFGLWREFFALPLGENPKGSCFTLLEKARLNFQQVLLKKPGVVSRFFPSEQASTKRKTNLAL